MIQRPNSCSCYKPQVYCPTTKQVVQVISRNCKIKATDNITIGGETDELSCRKWVRIEGVLVRWGIGDTDGLN